MEISIISHSTQYEQCWADDVLWREGKVHVTELLLEGTSRYKMSYPRAAFAWRWRMYQIPMWGGCVGDT